MSQQRGWAGWASSKLGGLGRGAPGGSGASHGEGDDAVPVDFVYGRISAESDDEAPEAKLYGEGKGGP